MRTIYAEYNINHDSIDVYTSAGYMLRIDCWEAEKNLKTTYGSECALTSLAVDEPLEYARWKPYAKLQVTAAKNIPSATIMRTSGISTFTVSTGTGTRRSNLFMYSRAWLIFWWAETGMFSAPAMESL